ncbi:ribosomal protein S8 (mitochondrion) [Paulinella micropora]|uniref:Ribosomal protein S8 n=1 Tax=Paulinella micropora TaxID=1928728 RepID=A0A5K7VXQ6_9EUKA|nr:ribosomal protein S8 [Paulinella micropora]BBL86691.1 ribosomal protein S8 [Paulinella micropora]
MANDLNFFLSQLNKNYKIKKEFFFCFKKKSILEILKLLEAYGFIKSFCSSDKFYKVFLKKKKTFKYIKFFLKPVPFILNKKKLLFLLKRFPEALIVLSSHNGVVCQKKALRLNSFGFLVFVIY